MKPDEENGEGAMSTTILLADDHQIFREGLRALLENEPNLEVIADAADGRTMVKLAQKLSPDVVIMDISMSDLNGIVATRQIIDSAPGVKVVALSMHSDRRFVAAMLKAGALGYVLKECAFEELTHAVQTVTQGRIYLSTKAADVVVKDYLRRLPEADSTLYSLLTPLECEVLQLLAEGKSTKKIAYLLHMNIRAVQSHRRHIMEKLDIHSISGLTKYAIREGLISLNPDRT